MIMIMMLRMIVVVVVMVMAIITSSCIPSYFIPTFINFFILTH